MKRRSKNGGTTDFYVRILAHIRSKPSSVKNLIKAGYSHVSVRRALPWMHRLGLVHIHSWHEGYKCPLAPVYGFGAGEDAPRPEKRKNGKTAIPRKAEFPNVLAELVAFAEFVKAMREQAMSVADLANESGYSMNVAMRLIRKLKDRKLVYIAEWHKTSHGRPLRAYRYAYGQKDAPMPKLTKSEINKRYHERKKRMQALAANSSVFNWKGTA